MGTHLDTTVRLCIHLRVDLSELRGSEQRGKMKNWEVSESRVGPPRELRDVF